MAALGLPAVPLRSVLVPRWVAAVGPGAAPELTWRLGRWRYWSGESGGGAVAGVLPERSCLRPGQSAVGRLGGLWLSAARSAGAQDLLVSDL